MALSTPWVVEFIDPATQQTRRYYFVTLTAAERRANGWAIEGKQSIVIRRNNPGSPAISWRSVNAAL